MKRDMDVVRAILIAVEARPADARWDDPVELPQYPYEQVVYHIQLLADGELVEARDWSTMQAPDLRIVRLTWQGHEFLDVARDSGRWNEAKKALGSKFVDAGFEVVKSVLLQIALKAVQVIA